MRGELLSEVLGEQFVQGCRPVQNHAHPAAAPASSGLAVSTQQAIRSAQDYLRSGSFSHQSLTEQLLYEGFTPEQAAYGVQSVGL